MPIDYKKYPSDWKAISKRIRARDDNKCKTCGVPNHAVVCRNGETLRRLRGNILVDCAGDGLRYPSLEPISYAEAMEIVEVQNCCVEGRRRCDDDGNHWFVVVLTVAHLNHDITDNRDENLAALCQQCHLRYDAKYHAQNAAQTRRQKKVKEGQMELVKA